MDVFGRNFGAQARLDAGYRTEGALDRSPWIDFATKVTDANQKLLEVDRVWQDARRPVSKALGARDVAAMALLATGRKVRSHLLADGPELAKERPYTDIFPNGTPEYFDAKVDNQAFWFGRLADRIETWLPPEDPVRVEFVPILRSQIQDWNLAKTALEKAESGLDAAKRARELEMAAWDATMLEVYGLLLPKVGKKGADRYISGRGRAARPKAGTAAAPSDPTSAPCPAQDPSPIRLPSSRTPSSRVRRAAADRPAARSESGPEGEDSAVRSR